MAINDGSHHLQRIAFEIKNGSNTVQYYSFALNPESMQETHTARTTMIQTETAQAVQRFGAGFIQFSLSGTTGWQHGQGFERMLALRKFLDDYLSSFADDVQNNYTFIYHNFTNNQHYIVEFAPNGFSISQNISAPLLYTYNIQFVAVSDASQASTATITSTVTGNANSSLNTKKENGTDTKPRDNVRSASVNPRTSSFAVRLASQTIRNEIGVF